MSNNKKPVSKITLYPVSAAIWKNETVKADKNGNGERAYYSVTFERGYKDETGKWQSSDSFYLSDLLLLAKVADRAHSEIYKLRAIDRQAEQIDE